MLIGMAEIPKALKVLNQCRNEHLRLTWVLLLARQEYDQAMMMQIPPRLDRLPLTGGQKVTLGVSAGLLIASALSEAQRSERIES